MFSYYSGTLVLYEKLWEESLCNPSYFPVGQFGVFGGPIMAAKPYVWHSW